MLPRYAPHLGTTFILGHRVVLYPPGYRSESFTKKQHDAVVVCLKYLVQVLNDMFIELLKQWGFTAI